MQPSPPKLQKTRGHVDRPFYEASKKTSAEIISEARSSVRALETKRPFTPAETSRRLFEKNASDQDRRPPSAFSISSCYSESRPAISKRLSPIPSTSELSVVGSRLSAAEEEDVQDINNNTDEPFDTFLPSKNNISPMPSACLEPKFSKSAKRPVLSKRTTAPALMINDNRRVQSGPKERAQNQYEAISSEKRSSSYGDLSSFSGLTQDSSSSYFKTNIRPLLRQMELNHLHNDIDSLLANFDVLWKVLEAEQMFGKSKLDSKRRSEILTSVFKCANDGNPRLLLKLSKLFLALEVSGKNLDVVCKLVFKVSRNKKYDTLFLEEELIEPLLNLFYKTNQMGLNNCLVYLAGTLKFLTLNKSVLENLSKHKVLHYISYLLCYCKDELSSDLTVINESCHMLIQITSCLSNLANMEAQLDDFISLDVIMTLLELTKTRYEDAEYFLNISRIVSKLTMNKSICQQIHKHEGGYQTILCGLKFHYKKKDIAVRMLFALGNIADYLEESRQTLSINLNGKEIFLIISKHYTSHLSKLLNGDKLDEDSSEILETEDIIIKVTRVIANLSMDEKCGKMFSNSVELIEILASFIDKSFEVSDHLIINIAATINNLSYFANHNSVLMNRQEMMSSYFLDFISSENMECVLEMTRVLGNFTQSKSVRELLLKKKVFEVLIALLDSSNPEMIFCACGVLINMMVDLSTRPLLKRHGGIAKLIDILKDLAESDWLLAGLVCQILWNYSEKIRTSVESFGLNETDDLLTLLNELLEPELALDYENRSDINEETIVFLTKSWEHHFKPVAALLFNRIEIHHSELEPLTAKPD